jgi:hypothetical protein
MIPVRRLALTAFATALALVPANQVRADFWDWFHHSESPPFYSPFRYWTPALARAHDYCHGPKINVYAPDRYPEVPADFIILKFPCQAVDPAATIIWPPTAPPTSLAR